MIGPKAALAAAMVALLCGCASRNASPPSVSGGTPSVDLPAVGSPSSACASLDNFFRASIDSQWAAGLNIVGNGGSASRRQIVEYERVTSDASKKQMALAASACRLFEAGKLGKDDAAALDEYNKLLTDALTAGARAEALTGNGDAEAFIARFKAALEASAASAKDDKAQFAALLARMETTFAHEQANAQQLQENARKARDNAEAARDIAFQALNTDVSAIQRLMMVEATVSTIQDDMYESFRAINADLKKFKVKWGITDEAVVRCDKEKGPLEFLFAKSSSTLRPGDSKLLTKQASRFVGDNSGCRLKAVVNGFSDPSGRVESNLALARRRAGAAGDVLRAAGILTVTETSAIRTEGTAGLARTVEIVLISEPDGAGPGAVAAAVLAQPVSR